MKNSVWVVWWNASKAANDPFAPIRVTVFATSTDDAYEQGRLDLEENDFYLGFPISAEPFVVQKKVIGS